MHDEEKPNVLAVAIDACGIIESVELFSDYEARNRIESWKQSLVLHPGESFVEFYSQSEKGPIYTLRIVRCKND